MDDLMQKQALSVTTWNDECTVHVTDSNNPITLVRVNSSLIDNEDTVEDYTACGNCGFDHSYELEQATAWHLSNPCSYCDYDNSTQRHRSGCHAVKFTVDPW